MALLVSLLTLTGCSKHDFIYDNVITGEVGPHAWWRIASSAVRAGSDMFFDVQYYTTVEGVTIDRIEVWYNVIQVENIAVTSRLMPAFAAFNNLRTEQEVRISQRIHTIPHSDTWESDSVGAYWLWGTFPVSNTLGTFNWEPQTFNAADSLETERLFGSGFMETFKQRMRGTMRLADFERVLVRELELMEPEVFNQFRDSSQIETRYREDPPGTIWINPETGLPELDWSDRTNIIWHFPNDVIRDGAVVTTVPPAEVDEAFAKITFQQLVQTPDGYSVAYGRSFRIQAHLRVFDSRGVFASTRILDIDVQ